MSDIDDRLTKADWITIPAATHSKTVEGSEVVVRLGISADFGGVGVVFELARKRQDGSVGAAVNILEARSAAGCGWQTSYGFTYTDAAGHARSAVFNQAAGNSTPYQWGYGNDYFELAAFHWNPAVSDHTEVGPTNPFDGSGVGSTTESSTSGPGRSTRALAMPLPLPTSMPFGPTRTRPGNGGTPSRPST